jgi:hypothetical protein
MITNQGILYIEPSFVASAEPVIDELTRKMTATFRKGQICQSSFGFHICICGARSSNSDYILPNGEMTNSLCVHYLAFHRTEVSEDQLRKVSLLNCGEEEPNDRELSAPARGQK